MLLKKNDNKTDFVNHFQGYYFACHIQILNDQIEDAEFLEFAIENFGQMI